jgi:type I restriction enzyme S subunit
MQNDLPSSWEIVQIGDICSTASGGTPSRKIKKYYEGEIPWVKSGELNDGLVSEIEEHITDEAIAKSSAKIFPSGSLLIALYGATVGRLGILTKDAATNQAVCAIFPPENVNQKYLFWYLRYIRSDLISSAIGGAQPNISQGIIKNTYVPIAPINEQIHIVDEIEKQFSRLDEAVENLKRVKANLKRYKASVLKAAVEGKLINITKDNKSFHIEKWQPIDSALLSLDQGWSPKCDRQQANESEWGVIKTTAVQTLQYIELENKRLPKSLDPRQHLELQKNDLLVTRAGPRKRVGVCCLVRSTRPNLILCDKVYRIRCNNDVARPGYLELVLNSPQIKEAINELKTGISDSGVNLTQKRFKALRIPLPNIAIQMQIESEVQRLWSIADSSTLSTTEGSVRCQRLRQSILKKAFSGELIQGKVS